MDPGPGHPVIQPPAGASAIPFATVPTPSQIPPTNVDIIRAHDYTLDIALARRRAMDAIADVDYADAVRYEARVVANTLAQQPLGLEAALEAALAPIRDIVTNTQAAVANLALQHTNLARNVAIHYNNGAGEGDQARLLIVPFPDGRYPSEIPGLPELNTVGAVRALTGQQRQEYLQRYYPGENIIGVAAATRLRRLFRALGCRAAA